jgi:hypothetical protein
MSMALSQGKVQQEASLSVIKMTIGDVKHQGKALQSPSNTVALQHAAQPHIGGNIDLKG